MKKELKLLIIGLIIIAVYIVLSNINTTKAANNRPEFNYVIHGVNREDSGYTDSENTRELTTIYKYAGYSVAPNSWTSLCNKINYERRKAGVPEVKLDKGLMEAMKTRAIESIVRWNHVRPNGEMCFSVNKNLDAEEMGWGLGTEEIFNRLMEIPESKKNILNPEYKSLGVGIVYNPNGGGLFYIFGFGKNEPEEFELGEELPYQYDDYEVSACLDELDYITSRKSNSIKVGNKTNISEVCDIGIKQEIGNPWGTSVTIPSAKWEIEDKSIASIDENGDITGLKVGETKVYTMLGSKKYECPLIVYKKSHFNDIGADTWYFDSVEYCYNNGLIMGTSDTTFSPNNNLTRANLVTILWRMEGSPKSQEGQKFSDVKSQEYYYDAVNWAGSKGIVNGYEDGKFRPNNNITREQLATILMNYARFKGKDTSSRADLSKFKDQNGISSYAKDSISWAVAKKVMSGKVNGTMTDPRGTAIRAEAAAMIQNYCNYVGR